MLGVYGVASVLAVDSQLWTLKIHIWLRLKIVFNTGNIKSKTLIFRIFIKLSTGNNIHNRSMTFTNLFCSPKLFLTITKEFIVLTLSFLFVFCLIFLKKINLTHIYI